MLPEVGVEDHGALKANMSTREVLITPPQSLDFNDQTVLGIPFFTAAYMLVNYNQQPPMFSLWEARADPSSKLIALDSDGYECGPLAQGLSAPGLTAPVPSSRSGNAQGADAASKPLSPGAIAGALIGAIALLAAVARI